MTDVQRTDLQVFINHCVSAVEATAATIVRTAHSAFVKETQDFTCALLTPEGATFAVPRRSGLNMLAGLDYGPVVGALDDYRPGDVGLTNDPYSGAVATHTSDIHAWAPVFHEGDVICFVASHLHNTDVGGAVPASLSRYLSEVHAEGIRFPPLKVVREGQIDGGVLDVMSCNVRFPGQNRGDLLAQLSALSVGVRRVEELIARFGRPAFESGIEGMLAYADEQARDALTVVPDGNYGFVDYVDEDVRDGHPLRIEVMVEVRQGHVVVDYAGSDPQVASACNVPTGGNERHPFALLGLLYAICSLRSEPLLNTGTFRSMRAVLPVGSVVNPEHPAAVGMRSLTAAVMANAIIGALSRAVPEILPAGPAGTAAMINVKTARPDGTPVMAALGPVGGGAGATATADGADGAAGPNGLALNTPIEINEVETGILFRRYGLVRDSAGAGLHRGGLAMEMEFEIEQPGSVVTTRNRDKARFAPWGMAGGLPGGRSELIRNPGSPDEASVGNVDVVPCGPGDVVRIIGSGAGGYGDPFERDPSAVGLDVSCGWVSPEAARAEYGVAVDAEGNVDRERTAAIRGERASGDDGRTEFDFGAARVQFETRWNAAAYARLNDCLAEAAPSWRAFVKQQLFDALADGLAPDQELAADEVTEAFVRLRGEFPSLVG